MRVKLDKPSLFGETVMPSVTEIMSRCLREIWKMVADAEKNHDGRLTKDQRMAIMTHCAYGLIMMYMHDETQRRVTW